MLAGTDVTDLAGEGATGSVLTNIALIDGLQALLGPGVASFNGGNIILGGAGGDRIEGRGGNDFIDGDAWLNVRISVRENNDGTGDEIATFDSMEPMIPFMLDGTYDPGQLVIVREILYSPTTDFDTAVFSGNLEDYQITTVGGITTVTDLVGTDGVDTLKHIERLQFADQARVLSGLNHAPSGRFIISGTPAEGQPLTVSIAGITDADNTSTLGLITGPIDYFCRLIWLAMECSRTSFPICGWRGRACPRSDFCADGRRG